MAADSFGIGQLVDHFIKLVPSVVPSGTAERARLKDLRAIWSKHSHLDNGTPKAVYVEEIRACYAFLYGPDDKVVGGIRIDTPYRPSAQVLQFLRMFSGELTQDFAAVRALGVRWKPAWRALQSTQFPRAIANSTNFQKDSAAKWIRMFEQAAGLTYEGSSAQLMLVVPNRPSKFRAQVNPSAYVPFASKVDVESMLFREKWVRAVVDGKRVALVASPRNGGQVTGFLSLSVLGERDDAHYFAPHESLRLLQAHLMPADYVFMLGQNGDIYVVSGKGVSWQRHQGRWRVLDYTGLFEIVGKLVATEQCAVEVVRMCADLSYERKGALICIPKSEDLPARLKRMIVDRSAAPVVNAPLRQALKSMSILEWGGRQVVTAAAGTDGATVVSERGVVLDISCMIGEPSLEALESNGWSESKAFAGARSRAAWNASLEGAAIKVSEDGPITLYSGGRELYTTKP